jgi:hypothetical protein
MNNVGLLSLISSCHGVSIYIAVGTTLTLRDKHGQETGSLVVQLRDDAARLTQAPDDAPSHDARLERSPSPSAPEPAQSQTDLATTVQDSGDSVLNSLKLVVEKMEIVAKSVSNSIEVHVAPPPPYQLP